MTPEKRAKEVVEYGCKHFGAVKVACSKCIAVAIREAVAAGPPITADEQDQHRILRAFASAAVLLGARLAQHEGLTSGVFAGPPEEDAEAWLRELGDTLKPLGLEGYRIIEAIICAIEGAGDWKLYACAAEINRTVSAKTGDRGIIEFKGDGAESGDHHPGCDASAEPLLRLLDVTRRWRFGAHKKEREECSICRSRHGSEVQHAAE